ncbi:bifunctional DnaQ family exonuclease/ATP-dependent helicase [Streptococcus sp. E17BB]|uniref:bifunctional DnaQ family exonuclease/ATP-dependent helicase n=1 Tax=Streptococcus sp. E17BB TaxID=3278714 RepID=UPI00359E43F3
MNDKIVPSYAVVDLEATGTGSTARIIQVGIVIIEEGKIVTTYETDVNPHQSLDKSIVALTGITDEQLAVAPNFSQVAKTIYHLLEDRVFVAHNVHFDANLLAEHLFLEGFELRAPRVDTVDLAQVCFPTLAKYSLESLSQELGLSLDAAHTAISDALATAQLFLNIIEVLHRLPRQTLTSLSGLAHHLLYETGQVIELALAQASSRTQPHLWAVDNLLIRQPIVLPQPLPLEEEFKANLKRLGLEDRSKQSDFAAVVSSELAKTAPVFIQGEAGLGKTYGYLLPLLAAAKGRQIVVAVPTKLLQEQLMTKEGQRLSHVFQIRLTSIKSSKHYLDLQTFSDSLQQEDSNRLVNLFKMKLLVWLLETTTGDLDEIGQKFGLDAYIDQFGHSGRLNDYSVFAKADFWRRCQQSVQNSQVIVTNHAFLLSNLQAQPDLLKDRLLVVDEAQRFFLAMESSSRRRVDITKVLVTIHQLLGQEQDLLHRRLLESLQRQLNRMVTTYYQHKGSDVGQQVIESLRQDLAEYDQIHLRDLREVVAGYADFWLETSYQTGKRQTFLVGAHLDFLNISPQLLQAAKAYFISATIAISKRVSLPDLLGLPNSSVHLLDNGRAANQHIWVDTSMPTLKQDSDEHYLDALIARLRQLSELNYPILVLLTSKQMLRTVSDRLAAIDLPHLAQDLHGNASAVKRRFDKGEHQVLLGLGTFWEGSDFADQDNLIILIPKLPFDNPKDPFVKKINTQLKEQGKQPFYDYALPLAGLRLKQALGRGTRREYQRSAVLILDSRLVTKPYGKDLLNILEQQAETTLEKIEKILPQIQDFCYNNKDKPDKAK